MDRDVPVIARHNGAIPQAPGYANKIVARSANCSVGDPGRGTHSRVRALVFSPIPSGYLGNLIAACATERISAARSNF